MSVLVLFAHPVETGFAAATQRKLVEVLSARRHEVDCDLYAKPFDPRVRGFVDKVFLPGVSFT